MIEDIIPAAKNAPMPPVERRYEDFLNAVHGIVWEADGETMRFTFVSDRAEEMLGYPARRWVDEPTFWLDHLHPDDRDWATRLCIDAAEQRRDHELEYRMLAADGRYRWLRETATVDLDETGRARLRGVIVDIGRQKAIEEELSRRDAILEAVRFAGERLLATSGSWGEGVQDVLERLGRATGVSRVYIFENYTGPDGEQWAANKHEWVADPALSVIGRPQLQALSYRAMHLERWLDALPRGEILYGHVREMPEVERPEFEDEGTLSYVLVPIFVDGAWWGFIGFDECAFERESSRTERDALKAAADMLGAAIGRRQMDEELRESQRSMQALLGNLPGMAYRSRPGTPWRIDFVSEGALELTGYPPSALVGGGESSYVRLIDPDDRMALRHEIELAIASRQPFHLNYRITTADGAVKWVMEQGRAIHDATGAVDRLEGIITDVTDRIQSRHLLQQRVEERTRELGTLLSVSTSVASTLELRPLLGVILDQLKQVVDHVAAAIFALDGDDTLRLLDYRGPTEHADLAWRWRLSDAGHSSEVIARREPVIIPDVRGDTPLAVAFRTKAIADLGEVPAYIASWMGVPLIVRDRVIGLLAVDSGETAAYGPRHAGLALAFATQAAVAIENARLFGAAEERTRELGTVLEISRNVAGTLELKPLLGLILDEVRAAVEYDGAGIQILHDGVLVQAAGRGPDPERIAEGVRVTLADAGPIQEMIERGEPLVIGDVWGDDPVARDYRRVVTEDWLRNRPHNRCWAGVPLQVRNRTLGTMVIAHAEPNHYTERDVELLSAMAAQAAVAIENARLYEAASGKAALEERQRLARELHDSVSQALFGIGLGARTARTLIDRDPAQAVAPIDYVLSLAEAGLAEMRALIFELRPEALAQEGLVAALKKQAAAMRARYGVAVDAILPATVDVPQPVQEAIYRIAQEALHNIVKHARASRVTVAVAREGGALTLRIVDDGVGFDPGGSFPGHLGLRSMAERAEKLGGTFWVESAPGAGSTIRVAIPTAEA
jgi:PAS domain S-box-containing protein